MPTNLSKITTLYICHMYLCDWCKTHQTASKQIFLAYTLVAYSCMVGSRRLLVRKTASMQSSLTLRNFSRRLGPSLLSPTSSSKSRNSATCRFRVIRACTLHKPHIRLAEFKHPASWWPNADQTIENKTLALTIIPFNSFRM